VAERRRGSRYALGFAVRMGHRELGVVRARLLDASLSGFRLVSPVRYRVGDMPEFEIWAPPTCAIRGLGQIVWAQTQGTKSYVLGIRLVRLEDEGSKQLNERLLEARRQKWQGPSVPTARDPRPTLSKR